MFSTAKQKILLGLYIFLILSIPIGAYLASQRQTIKTGAQNPKPRGSIIEESTASGTLSPLDEVKQLSQAQATPPPQPTPQTPEPTPTVSFGPTLSLRLIFEGRPAVNQAGRTFIGIAEGTGITPPKYLLSFTVDLPSSGEYSNLSLAGLSASSTYTAVIKGPAQIATASAFVMAPSVTRLNGGQPVELLSGDLNEDNIVNISDYSIARAVLGSTKTSSGWNDNIDLNKDGVVNTLDLAFIIKNMGKVGASGVWTSPPSQSPPSASLNLNIGGTSTPSASPQPPLNHPSNQPGHWIWVPR